MAEALLFILGFASVTSVYEIAKTGKKAKNSRRIPNILKNEIPKK